jgi:hypothetical protein
MFTDIITGSNSGVTPTAMAIENKNDSKIFWLVLALNKKNK